MQVSRELDYGIRAVVVLSTNKGKLLSKRTIAGEFEIPLNFLGIILPRLVHFGIVSSLPGPHGGYKLIKEPQDISIYDIVCAIERSLALACCQDPKRGCNQQSHCPISPHIKKLQDTAENFLKNVKFDLLARDFEVLKNQIV